jgi:WD40 repeat protein
VVQAAAFSPDGRYLATASSDYTVRIWSTDTWRTVAVLHGHRGSVNTVAFSSDGRYLATASGDGTARIWSTATWQTVRVLHPQGTEHLMSARFSPDGRWVVLTPYVSPSDNVAIVTVWATASGALVAHLQGHTATVEDSGFSPDGRYLATASDDGTAIVWDTHSWHAVATLRGHQAALNSVAFSPDGRWLVTGSYDFTARIWAVGTWQTMAVLSGASDSVYGTAFGPDGQTVVVTSADGTMRQYGCHFCGTTAQLLARAQTHITRDFTARERFVYLHQGTGA